MSLLMKRCLSECVKRGASVYRILEETECPFTSAAGNRGGYSTMPRVAKVAKFLPLLSLPGRIVSLKEGANT